VRRQPISKGFSAGLQIWLLFLLSLFWIGYPALMSIALGAIGGLASGLVVDWWQSKEENTEPERRVSTSADGTEEIAQSRRRQRQNSALRYRQRRRETKEAFNWRTMFKRND
jgi:predicted exporter